MKGVGRCALGINVIIIIPFSLSAACSIAPLTHMALRHMIRSYSQATSEDRHIGDATASLSNSEVYIEDIGRTVRSYFSSANKMSRSNKQLKHKSIYYPP
jgi:hypothetical protein